MSKIENGGLDQYGAKPIKLCWNNLKSASQYSFDHENSRVEILWKTSLTLVKYKHRLQGVTFVTHPVVCFCKNLLSTYLFLNTR